PTVGAIEKSRYRNMRELSGRAMTTTTDCTGWKSAPLLEVVRALAVAVAAGNLDQVPHHLGVMLMPPHD
ncbi:hypothetical protein NGM37_17095, partial [Streptomyces sp. TRM76130]|nr:hypothetical protein [Streptomyces sp. TRM76130]